MSIGFSRVSIGFSHIMLHGDPPVTGKGVVIYLYIKVRSTAGKGSNPPAGHILKVLVKAGGSLRDSEFSQERIELFLAKKAMVPDSTKQAVIFSHGNFSFL